MSPPVVAAALWTVGCALCAAAGWFLAEWWDQRDRPGR